ncbi:MAG: putative selenate reductase subunit YgfK [Candidatus Limiplasma sp.]|nr:putative selenate reductase subunit YgfK [Candidatus Limiplasma sp.]
MSDIMRPIPFPALMDWVLEEYQSHQTVFGVHALYRHKEGKTLPIFGEKLELPFGPAAGPHSQLAQNLIAAYAAGSRFFEVKTVQILDGEDLPVNKPCILAQDEGYNVEWSTELRVPQAFEEYVKGWFALKLISKELGLGAGDGFVFNMSVGYDLKGIQSEKIDRYIEGMRQAKDTDIWKECMAWAKANLSRFSHIDEAYLQGLDSQVCKSITLSTLHGCPPEEIERIATYLIREKKLHTYIKCNPTLLGYEFARKTMDDMGYDEVAFDDHHFKNDLQFEDAVPMLRRLQALAAEHGLEFGVKLTNTFPVQVKKGELPGEEMYMSGRSLFPLSIALAEKLGRAFEGKLRVSFSGGADQHNIRRIFEAGIWPITLATTLLKPGGYNRLLPMAQELGTLPFAPFAGLDLEAISKLAAEAKADLHHVRSLYGEHNRKLRQTVPLVDCFTAPCADTCPIHQNIPAYVELVGQGKYLEALEVICQQNPLPFITGTICNHRCTGGCTRNFYEEPIRIRDVKLTAAQNGFDRFVQTLAPGAARPERVAIIGGGPGGMAAAFLLARAGAKATIFEKRDSLGGIVRHVIPDFRIPGEAIDKDAALLQKLGVEVRLNTEITDTQALYEEGFTHVIVAIGAWKPGILACDDALNVLSFLEARKKHPEALSLGKSVVVVGGGNTAMDAARAAKRAPGVEKVTVVYRRTQRQMPADPEELELALEDGVEFAPLLAPQAYVCGQLSCQIMRLGEADESGRRSPQGTGESFHMDADSVISAIGEQVDGELLAALGVDTDVKGRAAFMTHEKLFAIGDAKRGPATVVEAIADAAQAVEQILGQASGVQTPYLMDGEVLKKRRISLAHSGTPEGEKERCLGCSMVCENCVDVCPNRANIAIQVPGMLREQVLHLDGMCNECGNCETFCPYDSAPYKDKFTLFESEEDFQNSENEGFVVLDGEKNRVRIRLGGEDYVSLLGEDGKTDPALVSMMQCLIRDYSWCLV